MRADLKEVYVFDSTPLIYLGKVRLLEKIKRLLTRNIIPASVYGEVVEEGKKRGEADAFYVQKLVEEHIFEVYPVPKRSYPFVENTALDNADKDVLTIARGLGARAILDDEKARTVAEIVGIPTGGSLFLLFTLVRKKIITPQEARGLIEAMIEAGWYCSTSQYAFIVKELERLSPAKRGQ
jgi:predicted nucleic acid-binding protein